MSKTFVIAKKELGVFFRSPMAYIVLIFTLSIFNTFFYMLFDQNLEASLRDIFKVMEFMFLFIIPLLTMKIFAEEKSTGTIEFLLTTPISKSAIVMGKFLGVVGFYSVIIIMTIVYYVLLAWFSNPDPWASLSGYIGIWLEGILFISIGLLASSWTKNQIVAAISSYFVLFVLYFSKSLETNFDGFVKLILQHYGTMGHLENFSIGLIHLSDIVFYFSGIILCLILTRISIDNRIWN